MYKKRSLESSETPVLYRGRTVLKVKPPIGGEERNQKRGLAVILTSMRPISQS